MNNVCVNLDRVSMRYANESTHAIMDLSISVSEGEFVLLLGPSGSGKTTLLLMLAGFLRPTSGTATILGVPADRYSPVELQKLRSGRMGFVFQNHRLIDAFTALDNVAIAAEFAGMGGKESRESALQALEIVGVRQLAHRRTNQLSHGEQQRVAIARAIVNHPSLILADEPTASLETARGLEIIELLHRLSRSRRMAVVVASHDTRLVGFADRVLQLRDGTFVSRARRASSSISAHGRIP